MLRCGRFELSLNRPLVMGVVNVTPDSFSDGGQHQNAEAAIAHAFALVDEGADILDIGGESTRPGAQQVSVQTEWKRIAPVLEALLAAGVPVSVDTRHAKVMRLALALGVDMINDVQGFRDPESIDAVAGTQAALCVMHMRGEPATMQQAPVYRDVVAEVRSFLAARLAELRGRGIARDQLLVDPGIGFGKTLEDNLRLLRETRSLAELGAPVLVGVSRKSMIGQLTGRDLAGRLAGSLAGALAAVARGAAIVRAHDVAATRDALTVWHAVAQEAFTAVDS
jgi:dihydropteroate synthase